MQQLTQSQAREFSESGVWREWDAERIVKLQLFQERLCLPWEVFHKAMEEVLGRPVWTHEFADADGLRKEYLGMRPQPTLEEIISQAPQEKLVILLG